MVRGNFAGVCGSSRATVAAGGGPPSAAPAATTFQAASGKQSDLPLTGLAELVLGLIFVDRSALRQIACHKAEPFDRKRRGTKERMLAEIGLELALMGAF